ncbi:MAG: alpha/beta fold hydrolase [Cyclobacteriaceae bacterium]
MKVLELSFKTTPEITLCGQAWGDATNDPVLLMHGGGQTHHSWGDTGHTMAAQGWHSLALDARGHGASSWSDSGNYQMDYMIADLKSIIAQLEVKPIIVGASMGGITGLLAEGESKESICRALVLVDIAPKVEQKGVERIFAFMSANKDGFESIDHAAEAIVAYLPHRKKPRNNKRLEKNLRKGANGRYYWHWDPKILESWKSWNSEERMQHERRMFEAARKLTVPTLIVRGGISDVISEKTMAEFLEAVPHVQSVDVSDAGHMVAGDSNHAFTHAVLTFINRLPKE